MYSNSFYDEDQRFDVIKMQCDPNMYNEIDMYSDMDIYDDNRSKHDHHKCKEHDNMKDINPNQYNPNVPGNVSNYMTNEPNISSGMNKMPNMMPVMVELEDDDEDHEKSPHAKKVDEILSKMEKNNPEVLNIMSLYGVPYPVARRIIRRIIRLSLTYYK